jgi:tetratricopeptide (TPR) repeat protein
MTDGRDSRGRSNASRGTQRDPRAGERDRRPDQRRESQRRQNERRETPRGERGFGPYRKRERDDESARRGDTERIDARRPDVAKRPTVRVVGERRQPTERPLARTRRAPIPTRGKSRRRRQKSPASVEQEIRRLAGRNADAALRRLMDAADAYANDREREALRILRPLRERLSDSPTVRELVGLSQYRLGNYRAAMKELEAYAELTNDVDQNPVLMDCYRAQHRWRKVEQCWEELSAASPSGELVAEGRIVYAGALADQGRLDDALALLRKRADPVRDPKEYHLRLWYALADLEERAGNLARARELFDRVRKANPQYVDVAERRAALG